MKKFNADESVVANIVRKWKFFCYLREQRFDKEDELLSIVVLLEEINDEVDRISKSIMPEVLWPIYCCIEDWLIAYYTELDRAECRKRLLG